MKLNRPLTFREKIEACRAQGEALPLKGHIKLVLEDVRDGTQIVTEQDNLITNAVSDLISRNFNGNARFSSLLPMKNLYSGIFLLQNAQTESATNWKLQNDLVNPLVAHAGDQANNTGSTLRGSPVSNEWTEGDTSISMVWLWDNTQGIGHIESASLVPNTLGNMGTKPFNTDFNPLSDIGNDGQIGSSAWQFNEAMSYRYPMTISDDGKTSCSVWLSGSTFKENKIRHDYFTFGIMRGVRNWQLVATRTATGIREGNYRFVFDDDDYYYICRASSSTALQIDKVSKSTFAVTQADVSYDGVSLYTGVINSRGGTFNGNLRVFAFDGTYLYFPNSSRNGFYKLNISDSSDKLALDGEVTVNTGELRDSADHGEQFMTPIVINDGLILGDNYIINANKVYPIAQTKQIGTTDRNLGYKSWLWTVQKGASCYADAFQTNDDYAPASQANVLNKMFKSSVVNLAQARDKSTSQTMRCIYSLTEQTS